MEQIKDLLLGLHNPNIVANFQKICCIEILDGKEKKEDECSVSYSHVTNANSDLHKRLGQKTELDQASKNGFVHNENICQNGSVRSNNVNTESNSLNATHLSQDVHSENKKSTDLTQTERVKFNIRSKLLFWIFRCGSELGNEFFYLTFFTFCLWNLNSLVTRQMAIIWHLGMYSGQLAKDIVCWPRPASPPCARLELRYEEEYGMPSTHATVGVIIPFAWILIAHRHYEFDLALPLIFATFWSLVCGLSRMYVGMHSLLDVLLGAAIGIVLIPIMMPYVEMLDQFQIWSIFSPLAILGGGSFLLYIYPNPAIWNTAKGDTATVVAVGSGVSLGSWMNQYLDYGIPSDTVGPYQIPPVTIWWILLALTRSVIGVSILVIVRSIVKPVSYYLFCKYNNVDSNDIETQRKIGMEKPQKYIAYLLVATAATHLVPCILQYLGLMRMSYYSEF